MYTSEANKEPRMKVIRIHEQTRDLLNKIKKDNRLDTHDATIIFIYNQLIEHKDKLENQSFIDMIK